ncbi:hypothetical protein, conserved [Eimeria tenella]|uniref:Uncharacterized protein n=1 Tax=Eimeria tenella TaxID=5802 RepID=U6L0S7_EIMTE|nr:hypothetical protein, conserved [Eimeria tenella]CDJ42194.1 hypothetical protein, conserved [Eimeria tenella]|eukprot:XP_013232944.1 hypothetical protein, conserved [Eimeria tenella]
MPTDKDRDKGYRCTPGTYCPEGSSSEQMCPVGTYGLQTAATGIDACAPCPVSSMASDYRVEAERHQNSPKDFIISKGMQTSAIRMGWSLVSRRGEKSLDEVCDEACRETRPQLILKESTLIVDNPETSDGDKEFDLEDLIEHTGLATGSYDCTETQGCTVRMFDTTLGRHHA